MRPARVFLDVTELVNNPLRTGIQRIERELMRHWPGPAPLVLCHFDRKRDGFVTLPKEMIEVFMASAGMGVSVAEERARLVPLMARGTLLDEGARYDRLLNTELFFDAARANAYARLAHAHGIRLHWIVMDFLPFLRPEYFPSVLVRHCMHYLRALRSIPNVGFISGKTRDDCVQRILRRATTAGPVFPLGGDGLGLPLQVFNPDKRVFVSVGTIEPRKNVASILEAFERLWHAGSDAELVVVGRMWDMAKKERALLDRLAGHSQLQHVGHISDEALRSILKRARATLFVSQAEGFGLPLFESLAAGIPVIVTQEMPSVHLIPPLGQIRLPRPDPDSIASAVARLMDDEFAARLWRDASKVRIPTWLDLARSVSAWVQEV
jgi:glycosyltransferase involved in cell wall biosynthesis